MPIKINGAKKKAEKTLLVSEMEPGEVFHFTSAKKAMNTGNYIRIASKHTKALHLGNFKVMEFDPTDAGVPKEAETVIR